MSNLGTEDEDVTLEAEIEALKSIYIHELQVDTNSNGLPEVVMVHLHPATAEDAEKQYVRLTLILILKEQYPLEVPDVKFKNPRGLSDARLNRIHHDLLEKARKRRGSPMLYELIEVAKEHLTQENTPSGQCVICLYGFTDDDVFTKTDCYHYFHSHCLARYISHLLKEMAEIKVVQAPVTVSEEKIKETEVVCPVCRSPISTVLKGDFPPPRQSDVQDESVASTETRAFRERMEALFQKQKAQGGIIDVEAERKRFLLEISTIPENPSERDNEAVFPDTNSDDFIGCEARADDAAEQTDGTVLGSPELERKPESSRNQGRYHGYHQGRGQRRNRWHKQSVPGLRNGSDLLRCPTLAQRSGASKPFPTEKEERPRSYMNNHGVRDCLESGPQKPDSRGIRKSEEAVSLEMLTKGKARDGKRDDDLQVNSGRTTSDLPVNTGRTRGGRNSSFPNHHRKPSYRYAGGWHRNSSQRTLHDGEQRTHNSHGNESRPPFRNSVTRPGREDPRNQKSREHVSETMQSTHLETTSNPRQKPPSDRFRMLPDKMEEKAQRKSKAKDAEDEGTRGGVTVRNGPQMLAFPSRGTGHEMMKSSNKPIRPPPGFHIKPFTCRQGGSLAPAFSAR